LVVRQQRPDRIELLGDIRGRQCPGAERIEVFLQRIAGLGVLRNALLQHLDLHVYGGLRYRWCGRRRGCLGINPTNGQGGGKGCGGSGQDSDSVHADSSVDGVSGYLN
jgi:hypothetical protein